MPGFSWTVWCAFPHAVLPPRASVACTAQASHPLSQILQCFEIWNEFLLFCPFPASPMDIPLTELCYWGLGSGNGGFSTWEHRWDGQKCFLSDWRTETQCMTKHCCQLRRGASMAPVLCFPLLSLRSQRQSGTGVPHLSISSLVNHAEKSRKKHVLKCLSIWVLLEGVLCSNGTVVLAEML